MNHSVPTRVPVSVVPFAEESIPSMIRRYQRGTGTTLDSGRTRFERFFDDPKSQELEMVGAYLGVDPDALVPHTLSGILGDGVARLLWRDRRTPGGLWCPACGQQSVWSRLVLVSACTHCGRLLVEGNVPGPLVTGAAVDMQDAYLHQLRHPNPHAAKRFERLWHLVRFHACTGWPLGDEATSDPAVRPDARPTSRVGDGPRNHLWRTPAWIAQFASTGWPATRDLRSYREHIRRSALHAFDETSDSEDDHEQERARLHDQIRWHHITETNLPDHIHSGATPLDGCHLEAIGHAIARALRREVIHAHTGRRPGRTEITEPRGPLHMPREIHAISSLLEETAAGARILQRQLAHLVAAERVDYPLVRDALKVVRTVPPGVMRCLSPEVRALKYAPRLAAAWIWIELTHGTLQLSPHHARLRTRLEQFHHGLLPEDRLVLLEYGAQCLHAVEADVATASAYERAVDARRYADAN